MSSMRSLTWSGCVMTGSSCSMSFTSRLSGNTATAFILSPLFFFCQGRAPCQQQCTNKLETGCLETQIEMRDHFLHRLIDTQTRANQGQMGKSLREVPQCFPGGCDLLGVQAHMIGIGQHMLQGEPRLLQATRSGQGFHQPETTDVEGSFMTC